jgi:hypothetical protein
MIAQCKYMRRYISQNMLTFHRAREAIASRMIGYYFIPGYIDPADILLKHWWYSQIMYQLKEHLFWKGNTGDLHNQEEKDK